MSSSYTSSSTYGQQPSRQQQQPRPQRPARDPKPIIYSLCIPRVFKNISEKRIRAIFYSLKLGFVERVDMVAKTSDKGDEFWRVFVHFSDWNEKNTTGCRPSSTRARRSRSSTIARGFGSSARVTPPRTSSAASPVAPPPSSTSTTPRPSVAVPPSRPARPIRLRWLRDPAPHRPSRGRPTPIGRARLALTA